MTQILGGSIIYLEASVQDLLLLIIMYHVLEYLPQMILCF